MAKEPKRTEIETLMRAVLAMQDDDRRELAAFIAGLKLGRALAASA